MDETTTDWNALACAGYETYAQVVRADQQVMPVPEWEDLGPRYHEAWKEAAKEICRRRDTT